MRCKETRKREKHTAPSTEKDYYKNSLEIRKIKVILNWFRIFNHLIRKLKITHKNGFSLFANTAFASKKRFLSLMPHTFILGER